MNNSKYDSSIVSGSVQDTINSMRDNYELIKTKWNRARKSAIVMATITLILTAASIVASQYDLTPELSSIDRLETMSTDLQALKVSSLNDGNGTNHYSGVTPMHQALDEVFGWMQGTLGKFVSVTFLVIGISIGIVRQSVIAIVPPIALAMFFTYSPTILKQIIQPTAYGNIASTDIISPSKVAQHLRDATDEQRFAEIWGREGATQTGLMLNYLEDNQEWKILGSLLQLIPNSNDKHYVSAQINYFVNDTVATKAELNNFVVTADTPFSPEVLFILESSSYGKSVSIPAMKYVDRLTKDRETLEVIANTILTINAGSFGVFFLTLMGSIATRKNFMCTDKAWQAWNARIAQQPARKA